MSEAQEFVAITNFSADLADPQFRTKLSRASRRGRITCSLKSVQYLLLMYVAPSVMRDSLDDLRTIRQKENELEKLNVNDLTMPFTDVGTFMAKMKNKYLRRQIISDYSHARRSSP